LPKTAFCQYFSAEKSSPETAFYEYSVMSSVHIQKETFGSHKVGNGAAVVCDNALPYEYKVENVHGSVTVWRSCFIFEGKLTECLQFQPHILPSYPL